MNIDLLVYKKNNLESVKWPKPISSDMRNFLEGLLTKDSTQRLTWPDLLQHPFVRTGVKGKTMKISFLENLISFSL